MGRDGLHTKEAEEVFQEMTREHKQGTRGPL